MATKMRIELARKPPSHFKSKVPLTGVQVGDRIAKLAAYNAGRKRQQNSKFGRLLAATEETAAAVREEGDATRKEVKEAEKSINDHTTAEVKKLRQELQTDARPSWSSPTYHVDHATIRTSLERGGFTATQLLLLHSAANLRPPMRRNANGADVPEKVKYQLAQSLCSAAGSGEHIVQSAASGSSNEDALQRFDYPTLASWMEALRHQRPLSEWRPPALATMVEPPAAAKRTPRKRNATDIKSGNSTREGRSQEESESKRRQTKCFSTPQQPAEVPQQTAAEETAQPSTEAPATEEPPTERARTDGAAPQEQEGATSVEPAAAEQAAESAAAEEPAGPREGKVGEGDGGEPTAKRLCTSAADLSRAELEKLSGWVQWARAEEEDCLHFLDHLHTLRYLREGALVELGRLLGKTMMDWEWETDFDEDLDEDELFILGPLLELLPPPSTSRVEPAPIPENCPRSLAAQVNLWHERMTKAAAGLPQSVKALTGESLVETWQDKLRVPVERLELVHKQFDELIERAAEFEVESINTLDEVGDEISSKYVWPWPEKVRYHVEGDDELAATECSEEEEESAPAAKGDEMREAAEERAEAAEEEQPATAAVGPHAEQPGGQKCDSAGCLRAIGEGKGDWCCYPCASTSGKHSPECDAAAFRRKVSAPVALE